MMYGLNKDEKEKYILGLIYKEKEMSCVTKREEPDFELHKSWSEIKFGVEITEFYFNESNARLRNIPTYFEEIMDKKQYRHKKDKQRLEVKEIKLISSEGSETEVDSIVHELPSVEEYIRMLSNVINVKNDQFVHYDVSLNHINLIVYDTECRMSTRNSEDFYSCYYTPDLVESIKSSNFREIFLIARMDKNKLFCFPLKLMLLLSEMYLLNGLLSEENMTIDENDCFDDMEIFAEYLCKQNTKPIYLLKTSENLELIYGNNGVLIKNGNSCLWQNKSTEFCKKNIHSLAT